jgi:hypothetical protein
MATIDAAPAPAPAPVGPEVGPPTAPTTPAPGTPGATPPILAAAVQIPELEEMKRSASFWQSNLPIYAGEEQGKADRWDLIAGVLSILTGLAIWGTIAGDTGVLSQAAVGAVAFIAGVSAFMPTWGHYSDRALRAAGLGTKYGQAYGVTHRTILAAVAGSPAADGLAEQAHILFDEAYKEKGECTFLVELQERRNEERAAYTAAHPGQPVTTASSALAIGHP